MSGSFIFLYGAPGTGKSSIGKILARNLNLPFHDLDAAIEADHGLPVWKIFAEEGEAGFRVLESRLLRRIVEKQSGVVALGGGALLDTANREITKQSGTVIVLDAPLHVIHTRVKSDSNQRPLLAGDLIGKLQKLLDERGEHYQSFPLHINTENLDTEQSAWQAQIQLGMFHVTGMGNAGGYDVLVKPDGLRSIGWELRARGITGRMVLVSDETVGALYGDRVIESLREADFTATSIFIPAGEDHKTIDTVSRLWQFFLTNQLDRGSTIISLGGGVVSDMTGFAAATYLRGIRWVGLPTTLLSMADASLGGKTGADLPEGKNLIGAFHAPILVMADPETLDTLPERELRGGFAEIVKHGVISDPQLFADCQNLAGLSIEELRRQPLDAIVRRAMAVKIRVIEQDPFEMGIRATLNAGHTIGHAVELASGFTISHGEAVAIGLVVETRMAEQLGITRSGLADEIAAVLTGLGLPIQIPTGYNQADIETTIFRDKKRSGSSVNFALPVEIGEARHGISLSLEDIRRNHAFSACFTRS